MVIEVWLSFVACGCDDARDKSQDTVPIEDTAPPIDTAPDSGAIDADGDGWTPNAGDCNDELAHVHPGAKDYCDGLDADCDGQAIPDGSCGEPGDAAAMWAWSFEGSAERGGYLGHALGDLDADGRGDIVAQQAPGDEFGPLAGGRLNELPARGPLPPLAWSTDFPRWSGVGLGRGGDVNGDGVEDAWGHAGSDAGYTGAVFLFLGRVGGFPSEQERVDLAADATWSDTPALEVAAVAGAADFDGDGLRDAALVLRGVDDEYWAALPGESATAADNTLADLPRVALHYDTTLVGAGFEVVSDLDGDGFDEVAATTQRDHEGWQMLTLVEGEDLFVDGSLIDFGHYSWLESADENYLQLGFGDLEGDDPDIDGDGLGDLTFGALEGAHSTLVFASGGVPSGDLGQMAFAEIAGGEDHYLIPLTWAEDGDGDSLPELMLHNSCLIPSTRIAVGGAMDFDDVKGPCIGSPYGYVTALTDMTGDGYPEWVFNDQYWVPPEGGDYYYNRALIIEGFPIPWDDPSKW